MADPGEDDAFDTREISAHGDEFKAGLKVMLDGDPSFAHLDPDLTIHWGAYLGTPDEILASGRLREVARDLERAHGAPADASCPRFAL